MTTAKKPRKPAKCRAISMRITDRLAKSIAALARESGRPVASCCSDLLELGWMMYSGEEKAAGVMEMTMRDFARIQSEREKARS